MIISFSVENFKSFRDRIQLRMDASADTELPDVVRSNLPGVPDAFHGMLTVASIHGANASGKSNIIKAARLLDSMVDIAIRFPDGRLPEEYPGTLPAPWTVDSFRLDLESALKPTKLEIVFLHEGIRWAYGLSLSSYRVFAEWLYYWPNGRRVELFARGLAVDSGRSVFLLDRSKIEEAKSHGQLAVKSEPQRWQKGVSGREAITQEPWIWGADFEGGSSEGQALAGRTRPEIPFLSVAAGFNHPQANHVMGWFRKFVVSDATQTAFRAVENTSRACESDRAVHDWIQRWIRAADLGISAIEIAKWEELTSSSSSNVRQRYQPKTIHLLPDGTPVAFDMQQESHGTNRLFTLALTLYRVLNSGGVLFIDELHSGLHPLLLRALVKIFQSLKRNPNHAQLIFTTHDVSVLDNSLLRRDQIHIVEKHRNGVSDLYSLSDCDDKKPRKDAPLIKYYLSGHLGGVPDLDIDAVFENTNHDLDVSEEA